MSEFKLTADQKIAIETLDQNIAVSAGAGTGKTRVLVERFITAVERGLANPSEILAITFTDKAANEMKSRVVTGLKERNLTEAQRGIENAYIGTIHSFCSRILKEHPIEAGIDPEFRVIEQDEADILKETVLDSMIENRFNEADVFELLRSYGEDNVREGIKAIHEKISTLGISARDALAKASVFDETEIKKECVQAVEVLKKYEKKAALAEDACQYLSKDVPASWEDITFLETLEKSFTLREKSGKGETENAKTALKKLMACRIEKLGNGLKKTFEALLIQFSEKYANLKYEHASFDFNDLQAKAVHLLGKESADSLAIRERYQKQFKLIMVDEFQDTDPLQVRLLELLRNKSNLFLVGDVKQSIYGFRNTNPALFLEKMKEFKDQKTGLAISLTDNFRSRPEILNFVNHFFGSCWKTSEIDFNFLVSGKTFQNNKEPALETLIIEDEGAVDEVRKIEAGAIASRIRTLVDSGEFGYKDFAILFRATTKMNLYVRELRNFGIPYYLIDGRGFYHQPEIKDLMNFLTAIENPLQDIPLASVMRSPMFQINDSTLFWLARFAKKENKYAPLFRALKTLDAISEIDPLELQKLRDFKVFLRELLNTKEKLSVSETIEHILARTQFDLYVLGLPDAKRHFANLKKLIDLARGLEEREIIHLGDFVRYIKGLEIREVRESEAQVEAAEGEVVKLLTIHKAKGLEFKVCILPDLLYVSDSQDGRMVFDSEYGVGLKIPNPETGEFEKSMTYEKSQEKKKVLENEEAKRLSYVAMTRAMEKLILSVVRASNSKEFPDYLNRVQSVIQNENLTIHSIARESSKKHRRKYALIERKQIREKVEKQIPIPLKSPSDEVSLILEHLEKTHVSEFDRIDLPVSAYLAYLHDEAHEEYVNTYELGAGQNPTDFKKEEPSSEEETMSAADFGTLIHKIFEHLVNYPNSKQNQIKEVLSFYAKHANPKTIQQLSKLIETFIQSNIYAETQKSKRHFPELSFVLRLKRGIIQGSLDLLYETKNGEWMIVDYKTSEITKDETRERGEAYRTQMELYALACAEITGVMPKKAVLYFVKPDTTYEILFDTVKTEDLREKYELLQKEIIEFRKELQKSVK